MAYAPGELQLITARWILPVASPPVRDGGVLVRGDRIASVGASAVLAASHPDAKRLDFPGGAILPGLVNVHTHLELTAFRGQFEDAEFVAWIRKLTAAKERLSPEDFLASARWGAYEAIRGGVTTVADAGSSGQAVRALTGAGLRGIAYQEVFGPAPEQAEASLRGLRDSVDRLLADAGPNVRVGVSPHAPYTVSERLFRHVVELSQSRGLPVSVHVAESAAEERFLGDGTGPMAARLRERGIAWTPPGVTPVEYLRRIGLLQARPLLVHAIRVSAADLESIAVSGAGVAHCPKSNAKLWHGIAPLSEMLARGVRAGLGTDGAVSNNACDLLEEARFGALLQRTRTDLPCQAAAGIDAAAVLRLLTLGGAEALHLDEEVGSLQPGKLADLCVMDLEAPGLLPEHDPATAIVFAASAHHVVLTMAGGRVIWSRDGAPWAELAELRRGMAAARSRLG